MVRLLVTLIKSTVVCKGGSMTALSSSATREVLNDAYGTDDGGAHQETLEVRRLSPRITPGALP